MSFLPCISRMQSDKGQFNVNMCMDRLLTGDISLDDPISKCLESQIKMVTPSDLVGKAARVVQNNGYVFLVDDGVYLGTAYHDDVFNFVKKAPLEVLKDGNDGQAVGMTVDISNIINQVGYTACVAVGTLMAARAGLLKKLLN